MTEAEKADELIQALSNMLEIIPDGATLRLYVGSQLDDVPMPPEQFVDFAREMLTATRIVRKKLAQ